MKLEIILYTITSELKTFLAGMGLFAVLWWWKEFIPELKNYKIYKTKHKKRLKKLGINK